MKRSLRMPAQHRPDAEGCLSQRAMQLCAALPAARLTSHASAG